MELVWYGMSCFRLTERKQASIVTDPYRAKLGLPALKLRGDVVTISHRAPGHDNIAAVGGHRHILDGPGEYEIGNVFVTGVATQISDEQLANVLYVFDYNGIKIAHLGDMAQVPNQTQIEALEQVNVLLVPVGGGNSLTAAQAAELVSMLEPNIVIPMHYKLPGLKLDLEDVDRFVKEMGLEQIEEEKSLKVTLSGLPLETQTVILTPRI